MERERHRDRHVNADHADFDTVRELARRVAIARKNGRAVAVLVLVDQANSFVEGVDPDHCQHRAENLLAVNAHILAGVIEQRRAEEVAGQFRDLVIAAVNDQPGALFLTDVDVRANLVAMLCGDQRPHVIVVVHAGADFEGLDFRQQGFEQRLRRIADRDDRGDRHAALACRPVASANERVRRLVHVGIRHDDQVILGAAERLHALAVGRGGPVDVFGHWRRTDEADGGDPVVTEN